MLSKLLRADLLRPDLVTPGTLVDLSLDHLAGCGIRALVLDVDRTILPRRHPQLPPLVEVWLREATRRFPVHLLSNNPSRRRIGAVAEPFGLPFTTSASKPRSGALRQVLAELGLPHASVAMVGDRLFTDVLAGNRLGLYTVLIKPMGADGSPCHQDRLQGLEIRLARLAGMALH
jgi:uncharacterized protein